MSEFYVSKCEELVKSIDRQLRDSRAESERMNGKVKGLEIALYDAKLTMREIKAHYDLED